MAFSLEQFVLLLDLRDGKGKPYLLIGGQPVCFWATRYLGQEISLQQWFPFVSEDIDFQGGRGDLIRFAKQLGVLARFPHPKEMTAWAGAVVIKVAGAAASADFLREIPGVSRTETMRRRGTRRAPGVCEKHWPVTSFQMQKQEIGDS